MINNDLIINLKMLPKTNNYLYHLKYFNLILSLLNTFHVYLNSFSITKSRDHRHKT